MTNHSDLTFITNENNQNLLERFKVLIKDTELFDVLVGYFYTSGFHTLYRSLESTKKIRILIGISTNKETVDIISQVEKSKQFEMQFSHAETKKHFSSLLISEMENSQDSQTVEEGIVKFVDWLRNGKLEIKAYPTENLHAKLYIMSFPEGDRDAGRVITGSSNFTKSGLVDNLEFNVELKNRADYEFAKNKFNELWENAVDVKDKYLETIREKTWLNDSITPYELYLKFLYEYFKDELHQMDEVLFKYIPQGFKELEYQEQAVLNAKKILNEYGGVFVSDVVGLGKTYVSALLASQLNGRILVIAPPILLDETNPGSWKNVFSDFKVAADFESLGKLDRLISQGTEKYKNIFIDEAHRFRTESNTTYEKLARICRGKRVILVTATPLNNTPWDILSQIKLFQNAKKSTIPNVSNLEGFFKDLERKIKKLDKQDDYSLYMKTIKENAKKIRESVLKYLMVRRTRTEIEKYFSDDLESQNLKFPEVMDPEPLFYQFSEKENEVFHRTVELIGKKLKYARYVPLTYYKGQTQLEQIEVQSQKNMGVFIKVLIIKRLESSFHAFKNSIGRFILSYEKFLKEFNNGYVYISKEYINKIFDWLESENDEAIQELLESGKAKKYPAEDFEESLKKDLENDLEILKEIQSLWSEVHRDPKLDQFILEASNKSVLKKNKLIVFTESRETAEYIGEELNKKLSGGVVVFTGASGHNVRNTIIENFDARAYQPKDDYRVLVTTEVLSEGVNLHRSNVVVNYDIPWNPTRLMQRVGRINRVDTEFHRIHTFNFFPTEQSNDIIQLKETAEAKIRTFISLLGADARLLTDGEEVESHELFGRMNSKKTILGEDEDEQSELKYLKVIKDIRDKDQNLFDRIKRLPKKSRTARKHNRKESGLLTYFRKGKLNKFFLTENQNEGRELDFILAATLIETETKTKKENLPSDFYDKLKRNKELFLNATNEEEKEFTQHQGKGQDSSLKLLKILKAVQGDLRQYTEEQEIHLKKIIKCIENGALPKQTVKATLQALNKELKETGQPKPLRIMAILQNNIPDEFLKDHISESSADTSGPREVILSEYLIGE